MASTRITVLFLSALLCFLLAPSPSSAIHLPNIPAPNDKHIRFRAAPPPAVITPGPSVDVLNQRLGLVPRSMTVADCAATCIASAVTKSTSCQLDDEACMCELNNAYIIQFGAQFCVSNNCGYLVANSTFSVSLVISHEPRKGDWKASLKLK